MAAKADALRERYALFSQGDLVRATDLWTEDFVWEGADESDLPGSGRHEGKQAALDVLKDTVGVWDTFELSADEFIEQDDTVVVLGHFDVTKGGSVRASAGRAHFGVTEESKSAACSC